ncbi:hypothetical protein M3G50_15775 [Brachybacterium muris]|uniref:TRM11 family SAM-dependent methyltransferase n=1 Tax=Brachybacterium muris TaxID=219301 RepID=UPI0021A4A4C2|nr:hypothetical protein [Brachybacterium muris]MCT1432182.1 hypothetical protein [Brachybacterium muris]
MTSTVTVLRAPSANRVYASRSGPLAAAEAHWVLGAHLGAPSRVTERAVGGMDALRIEGLELTAPRGVSTDPAPEDHTGSDAPALRLLASLSSTLGLLEDVAGAVQGEGCGGAGTLLRPLDLPPVLRHPGDLETILKYPGKTNEQFTALLVNLAAALSTRRAGLFDGTLTLLDPLCGRGTTLNRALRLGLSPLGAEIDRKDVEAYRAFLATWLRTHRYKHTVTDGRLTRHGKQLGIRIDAELAPDKQAQREGRGQTLTVYGCDTRELAHLLPARSVDAIVGDLPYGVQHGGRSAAGWQRSPLEVLAEAAPGWRSLLRDGGGMALAVNRHTLARSDATAVLADAGLRVISADGAFRHRVDQSIDRDVLLAIPTDHPQAEQLAALGTDERTP